MRDKQDLHYTGDRAGTTAVRDPEATTTKPLELVPPSLAAIARSRIVEPETTLCRRIDCAHENEAESAWDRAC